MKKVLKNTRGITLIALVITIIVLLILAAVSIAMLTGENGLLSRATSAKERYGEVAAKEKLEIELLALKVEKEQNRNFDKVTTVNDYLNSKEGISLVEGDIFSVDDYQFLIDRDKLIIIESLGKVEKIENIEIKLTSETSEDRLSATISAEITYDEKIDKITINGEEIEVPTPDNNVYKFTYDVTENGTYSIVIKNGNKIGIETITISELFNDYISSIRTVEDLETFRNQVNSGITYKGRTITLDEDLNLSNICGEGKGDWVPIGNDNANLCFEGNFEGNNHTISEIYINNEKKAQGLFGNVKNGSIKNLTVSGSVKSGNWVGGIAGAIKNATNQTIDNCTNNVKLETTTSDTAGGIVGSVNVGSKNVTINNCINNAEVKSGNNSAGGMVGSVYDSALKKDANIKISNCTNNGIIIANKNSVGGMVGSVGYTSEVVIEGCKNTNKITATNNTGAGGMVGMVQYSSLCKIINCSNTGEVTATGDAGGIIGICNRSATTNLEKIYNTGSIKTTSASNAGGIVGYNEGSNGKSYVNVKYACNNGSVYSSKNCAGGIVGLTTSKSETTIENSFNEKEITAKEDSSGGILGSLVSSATANISYCHNVGTIKSNQSKFRGGILGYKDADYTSLNNYWLSTCGSTVEYGAPSSAGGTTSTAKMYTSSQMAQQSNFTGWNFDTIWKMDTEKGYPVLQNLQ